jgi:hypothetical protein
VVVTAAGLYVQARFRLPGDGATRAIAVVAPVPDRLVVVGQRKTRTGGEVPIGWVLDVRSGDVVKRWRVPKAADRNWTVFDAAASPDRLYVSYHGGCSPGRPRRCATGADVLSWQTGELLCAQADRGPGGCIREIHGEVAALEEGALGTSGGPVVLRADEDARITQEWQSRLVRNHLMRLAYDAADERVFVLGSCLYAGGLARIDLDGGWKWRRGIATDWRPSLCGERISAGGGLVVFAEGPEGAPSDDSDITVVDAETGSVRARLPLEAAAVDVAIVG